MNSSSGNTNRQKTNQNIQVYVRVRPTNARERGIRSFEVVEVAPPKEIVARHLPDTKVTKKFTFDKVFGPDSKQCEVYQSVVAPLIEEVLSGYNCTVFAYGQTGTGKTHTMVGTECPELHSSWEDESMVGIIPRALSHLFDELRMMEVEFSMRISYLELYNEELCDLLSTDDSTKIRIFDDPNKKGSVVIQGLEEIPVHNKNDVYKLLEKGKERRKTATTLMNAQSSRSHTVFSILVHIKENGLDGEEMLKIGKLNLVDLAGSENISKAGNEKGIRARETVNINQSLLTLGRVITALVERTPHIPYRESKLTRILQESLGGRTKTSIIATISPGHKDLEETLSTLEYAHRAKNIQNKPELNQKLTKKIVLKEYTEEIDRLKRDLMAARDKNGIYLHEETYNDMQCKLDSQNRELTEKMLLLKALKDDLANKERIFNEVSLHLIEKSEELKEKEKNLQDTKSQLDQTKRVLHTTKRRYKESKILLENHVKTEQELSSQAAKLIEVADVVTSDTEKLHSTLEKRKDVDVKIQTACEQFTERMQNIFKKMDDSLENLQTEHLSHSEIITDEITKNTKLNEAFVSKVIDQVKSVSTQHQSNVKNVRSCIEKYCTNLEESNMIHSSAFAAMIEELQQREDEMISNVKKRLADLEKIINDQNSALNSMFSKIIQQNSQKEKSLAEYAINTKKRLKSFAEEVRSQLMVKQNDLSADNAASEASLQAQEQILLEFMEKMDKIKREEFARIEKRKKMYQFEPISDRLTNNVETEIQIVDQIIPTVGDKIREETEILTTSQNGNNGIAQKCTDEIACTQTVLKDFDVNKEQRIQGLLESMQEHKKCADSLTKSHKDEVDKNNEESVKQVEMSLEETMALGNQERSRIIALQTQITELNSSIKSDIKEYSNSHKRHMDDCCEHLENFSKSELKTYSPSGQTPSKKTYSYPRILAATSPHNLIIKRFRYENEWSSDLDTSTITEDSETAAELSDSCIGVNSTPIRPNIKIHKHLQPQNSSVLSVPQANNAKQQKSPRKSPQKSPNSRIKSPTLILNNENKENCN